MRHREAGRGRKSGGGSYAGLLLTMTMMCMAALCAFAGVNTVLPARAATQAATVQTEPASGPLSGLTIAVDAGHGGYDGGAYGRVSGTPEKGLNLDVARRVQRLLLEQGANVVMTRTDDYALCDEDPPIRKKLQDMQRRAAIIVEAGADIVLSIHMNEYAGRAQSGPQVFYREGCPAGRLLAGALQEAMIAGLSPRKEREANSGDYYILTLGVPSVLVECGFLSNAEEEALLLTPEYRERVAVAVVQGVINWNALDVEKPQPLEAVDRSNEPHAEAPESAAASSGCEADGAWGIARSACATMRVPRIGSPQKPASEAMRTGRQIDG